MKKNNTNHIQLNLFEDVSSSAPAADSAMKKEQSQHIFPRTGKNTAGLSAFELLYVAIKQIIAVWETGSMRQQQYAAVLRNRYMDNGKDTEIAKVLQKSSERIRQMRTEVIGWLMGDSNKHQTALSPDLVRQLKNQAVGLVAQDADEVLSSSKGGTLPYTLLDFVDMNVFEERDMADQCFIAPNNQTKAVRKLICELVKLLRSSYTPLKTDTVVSSLSASLAKQHIAFRKEWLCQIMAHHHWIETTGTQIQLRYEGLRYPSLKIARIVYEHKKIHKNDILRIYKERMHPEDENPAEDALAVNALIKRRDKRFQCQGKSGIWTFHEEAAETEKKPLREALHDYLSAHGGIIDIKEAETYIRTQGYDYPTHTLRCYLLKECVSSVENSDLLCRLDCVPQHPETCWRKPFPNRKKHCKGPAYHLEIVNKVKEMLDRAENHRLAKKEIVQVCKSLVPEGICKNIVYKIINDKTEGKIRQVQIEGTDYLEWNDAAAEAHAD